MTIAPFPALTCPLDNNPLQKDGSSWRCTAGHSYDIAREGYTNLLPVQNKKSRDPGDSKEMVAARRRFLNAGFYAPIANAVSRAVWESEQAGATISCLDAGCGEGYYLRELAAVTNMNDRLEVLGLDISKWAVLAAAKQDKRMSWVVGSNANLPVESNTLDVVLCMFGFPVYGEFARVLKPDGMLLQVDSGPEHLRELREIIYPTLKPERTGVAPVPEGFDRKTTVAVRYTITLETTEQIADLLAMTPHLYRATAEGRARAAALTSLSVTVDVKLTTCIRTSSVS
ncbi:MAG: methyltransferase domain-containing protein [Gammaproteobacteria bacterium]|nr:methyltransferase domain-containing protein [Gammaproteobacteria bacterium]MDP2139621.1 methyltransferase domain-containing protein [Gammaproteobacteria bacterium]MDP2346594.1 methyltransferase domain-containing protein [Gammaproteobacteria bacterium]